MKKIITLFCFCAFIFTMTYSQEKIFLSDIYSFLENTSVFELNQEEGHTPLIPYMSVNEALINDNCDEVNIRNVTTLGTYRGAFIIGLNAVLREQVR